MEEEEGVERGRHPVIAAESRAESRAESLSEIFLKSEGTAL